MQLAGVTAGPGQLRSALDTLAESQRPAPRPWMGQRLTVLWNLFNVTRAADERALTAWMMEAARLLGDLPHDIVATAIDGAVRAARHNFMPSVGEIRAIADPLADERAVQVRRLQVMIEGSAA